MSCIVSPSSVSETTPILRDDAYLDKDAAGKPMENVVESGYPDQVPSTVQLRNRKFASRSCIKPTQQRLVEKQGNRNVRPKYIPRTRYLQDFFTTIVDARWHWMLILFCGSYLAAWTIFAVFWYIIVIARGMDDDDFVGEKCFEHVKNFKEAFLLSVETMVTIGYGGRQVESKCPEAIVVLLVECLVGLLIDACLLGLIFAKLARPGKRQTTLVFSHNAVVTKRDGKFVLMFQVADVRKRQLSECVVRMHLFRTYVTSEGKSIPHMQEQLRVGYDWVNIRDDSDRTLLLFPSCMSHVIDRKSPFYSMTPRMLLQSDWEVIVTYEGTVEATGCILQARTSYLSSEIHWGFDFTDLVVKDNWANEEGYHYRINEMNRLIPAPYVPRDCSPRDYYTKSNRQPEDAYAMIDELWEDTNFLQPESMMSQLHAQSEFLEASGYLQKSVQHSERDSAHESDSRAQDPLPGDVLKELEQPRSQSRRSTGTGRRSVVRGFSIDPEVDEQQTGQRHACRTCGHRCHHCALTASGVSAGAVSATSETVAANDAVSRTIKPFSTSLAVGNSTIINNSSLSVNANASLVET